MTITTVPPDFAPTSSLRPSPVQPVTERTRRDDVTSVPTALQTEWIKVSSLRSNVAILALTPVNDEAGLVTIGWRILNQHGQTVCRAKVEALWKRDAPMPDPAVTLADAGFVPIPL